MTYGDAEDSLRADMAQYGLHPPEIHWDTVKHVRFTHPSDGKKNDRGWYKVHSDFPPSGSYGAHGIVDTVTWTHKDAKPENGVDMTELRAAHREKEKKRKATLKAEWAAAAKRAQKRYDKSPIADVGHPYLISKGITDPKNIRQDKNTLLIPMKHAATGAFVGVQTITMAGTKRFAKDTHVHAARTTLGIQAFRESHLLYITEGWATGWAIWKSTGECVIVSFFADNLMPVAKAMRRKYPTATIIIAADNDRWTKRNEEPNPGVILAKLAAAEIECLLAIPDFDDISSKPTDYNDLYLLEGEKAVRLRLDPSKADTAIIIDGDPPPPVATDELEVDLSSVLPDKETGKTWRDRCPFDCLGYDHGTYYYLPKETGQIMALTAAGHRREQLMQLAPHFWWMTEFPSRKDVDWTMATDALYRAGARRGVYRPERLRGRGCWREDAGGDRIVLHLGDRLLPPDPGSKFMDPSEYRNERNHIYERQPRIEGPNQKDALDLEGAKAVLEAFTGLLWHEEASGVLLAGWTVLGPVCGALRWRPHVWITGGSGSGKSTVLTDLILPLLGGENDDGGMNRFYEGASTEAGIRQDLRADAMPVLYDEAERTDIKSDVRIQNILSLARSASSTEGAHTAKGTTHGTAMTFNIRSMFCMASIGGAVRQEADKTRISLLQLRSNDAVGESERASHWRGYSPLLDAINIQTGHLLMARTVAWLRDGRLAETLHTFRAAATGILGDTRSGDQYGTLYAGAWTLMSEYPPGAMEARELIGSDDLDEYITEQVPEGRRALQALLQVRELIQTTNGQKKVAVGQMVDVAAGHAGPINYDEATEFLKQVGLKVDIIRGDHHLLVATNSAWIKKVLSDTPYSDSIHTALRTLKGVTAGGRIRFHRGMVSHVTEVPLSALAGDDYDDI